MTYEEIVKIVREGFENADAREIYEHIAVQVNIIGEGSGAFYIEVVDRQIVVEPYEYFDRDGLLIANADTLVAIAEGKKDIKAAVVTGALKVEGNFEKLGQLTKIKFDKKAAKKAAAEKKAATEEKKPASKCASKTTKCATKTTKAAAEKKPAVKKTTAKAAKTDK